MDLILLILALALAAAAGATIFAVKREQDAIRGAASGSPRHDLSPYELAYLAGGPRRAAGAAVGLLASSGAVRVSRDGRVHRVDGVRATGDPVEDAVLNEVEQGPGMWATVVTQRIGRDEVMDRLRERLTRLGLLLPDSSFSQVNRLIVRLRVLALLAVAGAAADLLTVAVEGAGTLPLVALGLMAGTSVSAPSIIVNHRRSFPTTLTASGRATLDQAKLDHPKGSGGPLPVALYGLSELHDANVRLALQVMPRQPARARGTSDGGGTFHGSSDPGGAGCGGGASCGGSGCGGGGGGGCGGGGR
ncbi:MAG: TIGR04222 domain-containing membrane protein [Nonomuraea sp.]|nr:TIGR04222 domain-containing membrane protein [Nonomuraea sp.]